MGNLQSNLPEDWVIGNKKNQFDFAKSSKLCHEEI